MQFRFKDGANVYPLASPGWYVKDGFVPPSSRYSPIIASGIPSYDYPGGELVEELSGDASFSLPLVHIGGNPQQSRRALEAFVRCGINNRTLQLQVRHDHAFDFTPLWGQWGAWETFEVVHAGALQLDSRIGIGDQRGWSFAEMTIVSKPATLGTPQVAALATGDISEVYGADGLSQGLTVADEDDTFLKAPASVLSGTAGTIVVAWESTGVLTSPTWFHVDNGPVLTVAGSNLVLQDGDNTVSATWAPPVAGTQLIFHAVYKTAELSIYVNGQVIATGTSFTPFTPGPMFIGSLSNETGYSEGVFRLVTTFAGAMTAGEVAADYADLTRVLGADLSPSPIPYMWTRTGANRLHNSRDDTGSTGAPHYNYGWIAGISGSVPALTWLDLKFSAFGTSIKRFAACLAPYDATYGRFDTYQNLFYEPVSSATADANSNSGSHLTATLDTTQANYITAQSARGILNGRSVVVYTRMQSGSTGNMQMRIRVVTDRTVESAVTLPATATAFRLVRSASVIVPSEKLTGDYGVAKNTLIHVRLNRSTGSGAALLDYAVVVPRPLAEFDVTGTSGAALLGVGIRESESVAYNGATPDGTWYHPIRRGDILRAHPQKNNLLMLVMGDETANPLIAWYADVTVTVTPRWSVQ
jgi:hypothetical protein